MNSEKVLVESLIYKERARQVSLGYSFAHDQRHGYSPLFYAGLAYEHSDAFHWPWEPDLFHPHHNERDWVKAGALYLSAMDQASHDGELTQASSRYQGIVNRLEARVRQAVETLRAMGLDAKSALVVVSDS